MLSKLWGNRNKLDKKKSSSDHIWLSFPMHPAYLSSARLTVFGIAKRLKFNLDEIEDIKTAVSEACVYVLKRSATLPGNNFEMCFKPGNQEVYIEIIAPDSKEGDDPAQLQHSTDTGLIMINALVDKFTITKSKEGQITIIILKRRKGEA